MTTMRKQIHAALACALLSTTVVGRAVAMEDVGCEYNEDGSVRIVRRASDNDSLLIAATTFTGVGMFLWLAALLSRDSSGQTTTYGYYDDCSSDCGGTGYYQSPAYSPSYYSTTCCGCYAPLSSCRRAYRTSCGHDVCYGCVSSNRNRSYSYRNRCSFSCPSCCRSNVGVTLRWRV